MARTATKSKPKKKAPDETLTALWAEGWAFKNRLYLHGVFEARDREKLDAAVMKFHSSGVRYTKRVLAPGEEPAVYIAVRA